MTPYLPFKTSKLALIENKPETSWQGHDTISAGKGWKEMAACLNKRRLVYECRERPEAKVDRVERSCKGCGRGP